MRVSRTATVLSMTVNVPAGKDTGPATKTLDVPAGLCFPRSSLDIF